MQEVSPVFETLVHNINIPILLVDRRLDIVFANREAVSFLGLPSYFNPAVDSQKEQWSPSGSPHKASLISVVYKGSFHTARTICEDCFNGATIRDVKMRFRGGGSDRRTKVLHCRVSCVPIVEGDQIRYAQLNIIDVTDQENLDELRRKYFKRLESELEERARQGKEIIRGSILAIAMLAESIDDYTNAHLIRMAHYSKLIAKSLQETERYKNVITDEYIELIFELSPLHDIGKVAIRDAILQKPGKLSNEDMEVMKSHASIGADVLKQAGRLARRQQAFALAEMIARFHHQRWDGTGYPPVDVNGELRPLRGEEIPLCARIVSLADVFDALTSERPYKMPYPYEMAKKMVLEEAGRHFDPFIVNAFFRKEADILDIRKRFPDKCELEPRVNTQMDEFKLAERDSEYIRLISNEHQDGSREEVN